MNSTHAAVILAGGKATRMGGVPKSELKVGGRALIERVLAAVDGAAPRVVVGDVPARGTVVTIEDRHNPGPAYAVSAAMPLIPESVSLVAVLAADLPFLTADVMESLRAEITPDVDGAVLIDHSERRQWLCGVWRNSALRSAVSRARPGTSMGRLFAGLTVVDRPWPDSDLPPWFDCDTPEALAYARSLDRQFRRPNRAEPTPDGRETLEPTAREADATGA